MDAHGKRLFGEGAFRHQHLLPPLLLLLFSTPTPLYTVPLPFATALLAVLHAFYHRPVPTFSLHLPSLLAAAARRGGRTDDARRWRSSQFLIAACRVAAWLPGTRVPFLCAMANNTMVAFVAWRGRQCLQRQRRRFFSDRWTHDGGLRITRTAFLFFCPRTSIRLRRWRTSATLRRILRNKQNRHCLLCVCICGWWWRRGSGA